MSSEIQILPISRTRENILRFLKVAYPIYREDAHWVAPLLMDLGKVFTDANPFLEHAEMTLWVATRDGRDVGRIAGIVDRHHIEHRKDPAAFFGFFECINDAEASRRLFDTALAWARQKGLQRVLGPMNPSTNDECGLLVDGFGGRPVLMMPHNPPYYPELVAAAGFQKAKDLYAYFIDLANSPLERLNRVANALGRRLGDLRVRRIRRKSLASDLGKVKEIYNDAWEENWGFVPMTDAEINFLAERLKPLLEEGLVYLAEIGTEPAAFLLAMPDYNEAFLPLRGRLLTPQILGFIPYALGWKRPAGTRLLALGIKQKYRNRGIEAAMLSEGLKFGIGAGFRWCEASWILEDNVPIQRVIEMFAGKPYRTYRIYERAV